MDMLPSLCAAMVRANGDSLVLASGRAPYVVSGAEQSDVAKATLSDNALEALVGQIFSSAGNTAFRDAGRVVENVDVPSSGLTLIATAERRDGSIWIELRRTPAFVEPETAPEPSVDESLFAMPEPEHPLPTAADHLLGWERTPGLFAEHESEPFEAFEPAAEPESPEAESFVDPLEAPREDWSRVDFEAQTMFESVPEPVSEPEPEQMHEPTYEPEPESVQVVPTAPVSYHAIDPVAARTPAPWTASSPMPETDLMAWATDAAEKGATTVYLRAASVPMVRVEDRLDPMGTTELDQVAVDQLIGDLEGGGDPSWQRGADGEWSRLDAAMGRIACRIFSDDQGRGLIMRLQPRTNVRGLHRLVPRQIRAACDGDGLIVVSAPSADESLAMAGAVADLAGKRRGGFVVALRLQGAPRPQLTGAFVSQREFAPHETISAIRNAVAESPDILLVTLTNAAEGVAREVAKASESGRLVVLSVAAPTSLQAVRSLVGRGSSVGDAQLRLSLAGNFRAAFATRTLRRLGGGRTVVQDLLLGTSEVSGLLASGDFAGITRLQRQGQAGMFTVDERLARGVRRGHLPLRQAVENSLDRRHLVSLVRSSSRIERRTVAEDDSLESSMQPVAAGRATNATRWSR